MTDNLFCNIFFGIFAWLFNRKGTLLQIPLLFIVTNTYPEILMEKLDKTDLNPKKLSLFLFLYTIIVFLFLIVGLVLPLKALIKRERPERITTVFRYINMRDLEHG